MPPFGATAHGVQTRLSRAALGVDELEIHPSQSNLLNRSLVACLGDSLARFHSSPLKTKVKAARMHIWDQEN